MKSKEAIILLDSLRTMFKDADKTDMYEALDFAINSLQIGNEAKENTTDKILTEKEIEILKIMYEHMLEILRVINAEFTPNDLYYLMEKIGLDDVVI